MTDTEIKNRIESLARLDDATWESLCKCCGVCCMLKHSRHTGTYYTSVACNNLNLGTRRCAVYSTPGPWNHIIDDSLGWRTRAMELRDKYADFGRDILCRIARTTQK